MEPKVLALIALVRARFLSILWHLTYRESAQRVLDGVPRSPAEPSGPLGLAALRATRRGRAWGRGIINGRGNHAGHEVAHAFCRVGADADGAAGRQLDVHHHAGHGPRPRRREQVYAPTAILRATAHRDANFDSQLINSCMIYRLNLVLLRPGS